MYGRLERVGEFWIRKLYPPKGTILPGHKHYYDHLSIAIRGSVKVTTPTSSEITRAGQSVNIPMDVPHTLEFLEDNSEWWCVFTVHDGSEKDHMKVEEPKHGRI